MNLSDYIRVYPKVLSSKICRHYIDLFEQHLQPLVIRNQGPYNFSEINTIQAGWDLNVLFEFTRVFRSQYFFDCNITEKNFNFDHSYEEFRMKRYIPHLNQEFKPHVDAWDIDTAKRFIVAFWYLNDVSEGGETVFFNIDKEIKVKPEEGTLIMFPATWQYIHAGLPPISNPKYIIGTYFHHG